MNARRWVLGALAAGGALLGAHALVARTARCPITTPTADELEQQRLMAMGTLAGAGEAPTRALDPLVLGRATRAEVATALGPACTSELGGALVICTRTEDETVARFDRDGILVGLDRSFVRTSAQVAAGTLVLRLEARRALGAPERTWGEPTGAFLSAPLRQAGASWRFRDLAVDVTATHLAGGVVVREQQRLVGTGKS